MRRTINPSLLDIQQHSPQDEAGVSCGRYMPSPTITGVSSA